MANYDKLDLLLQKLALKAQQAPRQSKRRRIYLTQTIGAIAQSGKLYSQDRYQVSVEVYNEALAAAFLEVCRKIENYDPAKGGPCAWVNQLLDEQLLNGLNR